MVIQPLRGTDRQLVEDRHATKLVTDGGEESAFPAPGSAEHVLLDTHGAGGGASVNSPGPVTGHDTIHLIDPNEAGSPLCGLDGIPVATLQEIPRVDLAPEIDRCPECERTAVG